MKKYKPTPGMVRALKDLVEHGDLFPGPPGSMAVAGGRTTVWYALLRRGYITGWAHGEKTRITQAGRAAIQEYENARRTGPKPG